VKLVVVIALTVLSHTGFVGSRVTVSLYAIHQHASPLTIGLLLSLYALLPMILAVSAGRLIDRVGVLRPMAWAGIALTAGLLLPFAWPSLDALFIAATVIGTSFMFYHVALNHIVGSMGNPADRPVNFSWFALGFSVGGFCGPLLAGFAIDATSHRIAFLLLALFPAAGVALLYSKRQGLPTGHGLKHASGERNVIDLLREPRLRAAFLASALLAMGWDLYTFVMPIYGTQIGLSATTIGVILASFAAATFTVRLSLPVISRYVSEWPLITATFVVACIAYALFPFVETVALLASISFFLGLGLGATQPSLMALLYATAPAGRAAEAVGVRTVVLNTSSTLLPLVFGGLGTALGMATVFWTMSGALAGGGVFANGRRVARA